MATGELPELRNFFNFRELFAYVRIYAKSKGDPTKRAIARAVIMNVWVWPFLTVLFLETFWHFVFKLAGR